MWRRYFATVGALCKLKNNLGYLGPNVFNNCRSLLCVMPLIISCTRYVAFELCGPDEILVMASTGPWESVGGDIKFLRLAQRKIGGLVTDGSVRDTDEILK